MRSVVLPVLLVVAAGCSPPSDPDGAWELPLAEQIVAGVFSPAEPVLDLRRAPDGDTLPAYPVLVLGEGWAGAEPWGTWAIGGRSVVQARLISSDQRLLVFECKPYRRLPDEPVQAVSVEVNGSHCGTVELQEGVFRRYSLLLPSGVLRPGANEIVLGHRYHHSAQELGLGQGTRQLATGFRWIALAAEESDRRLQPAGGKLLRIEDDSTVLLSEPGTAVVPLQLPGGRCRLELGVAVRSQDQAEKNTKPLRLDLSLLSLAGDRHELLADTGTPQHGDLVVPLPETVRGWCLLVIDARFPAEMQVALQSPRFVVISAEAPASTNTRSTTSPDMVVVILDAARPDHFGCYGYERPTTPSVDELAHESLVFRNVIAHASYTSCSLPTMLTGLPFTSHGATRDGQRLDDSLTTLAEYLRNRGYATIGITASPHHTAERGLHQGYDEYLETWQGLDGYGLEAMDPHRLVALAREQLHRLPAGKSLCMVLHAIPPHWPYLPPARFDLFKDPGYRGPLDSTWRSQVAFQRGERRYDPADRARLLDLYDGNLRRADDAIGQLLQALRARPRWSDTVVLVVADHGEAFWEHGLQGHSKSVYHEMLRVPFILRLPPQLVPPDVDLERFASLADLVPTLLGLAGITPDPGVSGVDLLAPTAPVPLQRWVVSRSAGRRHSYAVSTGRWKAVVNNRGCALYDLRSDPKERHDLAAEHPLLATGLVALLRQSLSGSTVDAAAATRDQDEIEALHALGYLDDGQE